MARSKSNEPHAPWFVMKGLSLILLLGTILGFVFFGYYTLFAHTFLVGAAQRDTYEQISDAHQSKDWDRVVDIYHSRVVVPFWFDQDVRNHTELHAQVGDAYSHIGNRPEATGHYLDALGWSKGQYDAWCGLTGGCASLPELAKLARTGPLPTTRLGDDDGNQ